MQHILVTGGAGFIGSNFTRYMLAKYPDLHVTVYDKLTYAGLLTNLQDIAEQYADRYSFAQGDICDAVRVREVIAAHDIDTIVNFAAETHVDRSILDPNAFIQTDVFGTYVLLEAARQAGNLRYHQISTDEVYGHIEGEHRSKETDNLAPRSPYAASKAGGDHLVNSYFITYGLPITISRGANNIGPYQYPEKALPLFATNALNDQPLPVYGDGRQRRDYQHVLDHCQAIDLILHEGVIGETYNIGTGTEMTNLEMIGILLDELGKPRSLIRHVEDRLGHDRRYCLDVQKIMALGWEPDYSHEEAIRATARWYRDNSWWWEPIRNGEFKAYYAKVYGNRKVLNVRNHLMPLLRANANHLAAINQLLQNAYYRYVDMGMEDLPGLLNRATTVIGIEQSQGSVWGVVGVQVEDRPVTMPSHAPTRAHLRAVAFQHSHPPEIELARLMGRIVQEQTEPYSVQYLCYGAEYWLSKSLNEAGFEQVEAVQFYQLDRLRSRVAHLPPAPPELSFTPLYPAQLDELAILDAATFDPLWHFGRRDLFELLMRGRIQVAWWDGRMVGYSAVCANSQSEAQLARLAVHPDYQGRGVGRALLSDAIRYVAAEFAVLVLNTQVNNNRSQSLYRSLNFRPIGMSLAVLGLTVA